MQLEQLAELERQDTQLIVVEIELAQTRHVTDLSWESANLVVGHVEILQIDEIRNDRRQTKQIVVVETQTTEVSPLPQLGTNILDKTFDVNVEPLRLIPTVDVVVIF